MQKGCAGRLLATAAEFALQLEFDEQSAFAVGCIDRAGAHAVAGELQYAPAQAATAQAVAQVAAQPRRQRIDVVAARRRAELVVLVAPAELVADAGWIVERHALDGLRQPSRFHAVVVDAKVAGDHRRVVDVHQQPFRGVCFAGFEQAGGADAGKVVGEQQVTFKIIGGERFADLEAVGDDASHLLAVGALALVFQPATLVAALDDLKKDGAVGDILLRPVDTDEPAALAVRGGDALSGVLEFGKVSDWSMRSAIRSCSLAAGSSVAPS